MKGKPPIGGRCNLWFGKFGTVSQIVRVNIG